MVATEIAEFCEVDAEIEASAKRNGMQLKQDVSKTNGRSRRMTDEGRNMYQLAKELFPICRSLTGDGVRETLHCIEKELPALNVFEVPSGTHAFDWTVPDEWNIRDGYIEGEDGKKYAWFKESNLHIVGYSVPVDQTVSLSELLKHIYVQDDQPDVIPYVTSYYAKRYGFCMSKTQRDSLPEGNYRMFIDSSLKPGSLTYGELIIPATKETDATKEIFLSTYICHPSMANNELSGPCVAVALAKWLYTLQSRRYTYRISFIPETLGSIVYLSKNLDTLKKNVVAGFNISCVGDDRQYSYVASRKGDTLADRIAKNVLDTSVESYVTYSFLQRGSDERQYNAPGVDLPVCSICRTKYGEYPEYHTSADDLSVISPKGLQGAYDVYRKCIMGLEYNRFYQVTCLCEPQLGKRGLYPTESYKGSANAVRDMMNLIAYADGTLDLIDISNTIKAPISALIPLVERLLDEGLFRIVQ